MAEKSLSWKRRAVTQLEWIPESLPEEGAPMPYPTVDAANAAKWSTMAITNPIIWSDPNTRLVGSRLIPEKCPIVITMACAAQMQDDTCYGIKDLAKNNQARRSISGQVARTISLTHLLGTRFRYHQV